VSRTFFYLRDHSPSCMIIIRSCMAWLGMESHPTYTSKVAMARVLRYEWQLCVRLFYFLFGHIPVDMNPFWGITDTSSGDPGRSARSVGVFDTSCCWQQPMSRYAATLVVLCSDFAARGLSFAHLAWTMRCLTWSPRGARICLILLLSEVKMSSQSAKGRLEAKHHSVHHGTTEFGLYWTAAGMSLN
jgi:hypothetical protein